MSNTIHSFWYSKNTNKNAITTMEVLCIASYLSCNHSFVLYTYTPQDASMLHLKEKLKHHKNFSNFFIKDANEILTQDKIFFDDRGNVGIAAFSDYFRYHILHKMGGWWVDTDTICVQNLESLTTPFVFASERDRDSSSAITTCVIKAPKDSPVLLELISEAQKTITNKNNRSKIKLKNILKFDFANKIRWGIIGPKFLDNFIKQHEELKAFVAPPHYFCDINWFDVKDFVIPQPQIKINTDIYIYIYHLWNAKWFDLQLDKNATYPNSIYQYFKEKYLVQ